MMLLTLLDTLHAPEGLDAMLDGLVPDGVDSVWALIAVLVVLALVDSTSFGTLLIPIWLLMVPGRVRVGRVLLYLAVVAGAYALIGLGILTALLTVGDELFSWLASAQEHPGFLVGQAALAAAMMLISFSIDPVTKAGKERRRLREEALAAEGRGAASRMGRMRERAVGEAAHGGVGALLGLGVAVVGLEIATLLPYLAGIGLVAAENPGMPVAPALVLLYCGVMVAPALMLLIGRIAARRALERPLQRIEGFLSRHANGTIAWIVFLLGLWLGLGALGRLGVL